MAGDGGNVIDPHDLGRLRRALLAESLAIVNRFKELVRHHFKLTYMMGG